MGNTRSCSSRRRFRRHLLIISVILLFGSTLFPAEGRVLPAGDELRKQLGGGDGVETAGTRRGLIGSSPPRCERRCSWCRRCEAVQVPIVPQQQKLMVAYSRGGDDISNYKPMAWKCKCGGLLFNP